MYTRERRLDMSKQQDTESLFKKKLNIAIPVMVFMIVIMVIRGIENAYRGYSPISFIPDILESHLTALIYAIFLLVFAAIGKAKGKENRIMSFVFGICTIVLCGLLILDRALLIRPNILGIQYDIEHIPSDVLNIPDLVLDLVVLAFNIVIIALSILSIVNSVGIIKENVPSGSTATRPASSGFVGQQPTMASTPPPAASSIPKSQFCASCGAPLDAGAAFCNKCGAKV